MPSLTIAQLLSPMTAAQIRSSCVTALQALGLQPQNWATGGIASSTLTVSANILALLSTQLSGAIAQQWNPTASGGGLQLLSQYFFGLTPPQATFASGQVTLTNTGGGVYSYGAGQATFQSSVANSSGVYPQYTNTAAFTLLANSTLTIDVQCTEIGTAGNSAPGFVSLLITQMLGVSVTNANPILGTDALADPQLRQLNANSLAVRGSAFGPRGAYAYAIQTAVNSVTGAPVNVNRWQILIASHTGDITIFVASPQGAAATTDLQGIGTNIDALARPDGVTVLPGLPGFPSAPASATPIGYDPGVTAYVVAPAGTSPTDMMNAINTALSTWFEGPQNPIGGLTASDDNNQNITGIFESGIVGLIGAAVSAFGPGCYLLSTKFTNTSGEVVNGSYDLELVPGQVATWAPPNPSVPIRVIIQSPGP